jgi:hypothetical protein
MPQRFKGRLQLRQGMCLQPGCMQVSACSGTRGWARSEHLPGLLCHPSLCPAPLQRLRPEAHLQGQGGNQVELPSLLEHGSALKPSFTCVRVFMEQQKTGFHLC